MVTYAEFEVDADEADMKVVSLTRSSDDPPYEDVLPHCDDYLSAAHIERLIRAKMPDPEEPCDENNSGRYGISFFAEVGSPTGYIDFVVDNIIANLRAQGIPMLTEVRAEYDDAKKLHIGYIYARCKN